LALARRFVGQNFDSTPNEDMATQPIHFRRAAISPRHELSPPEATDRMTQ